MFSIRVNGNHGTVKIVNNKKPHMGLFFNYSLLYFYNLNATI